MFFFTFIVILFIFLALPVSSTTVTLNSQGADTDSTPTTAPIKSIAFGDKIYKRLPAVLFAKPLVIRRTNFRRHSRSVRALKHLGSENIIFVIDFLVSDADPNSTVIRPFPNGLHG